MARNQGRHRIARRTKIATGAIGLAIAVGALVVTTTNGDVGQASADEADPALYVDITTVKPNVVDPPNAKNASTGTFTVNCGTNENGHFNGDNFIAAPGVLNGAQHLHDYVGNLSTNANSNNKSLEAAGTTCKNGDKSAYFWPVIRIDDGSEEAAAEAKVEAKNAAADTDAARAQAGQDATVQQVNCPDVASKLPAVPGQAAAEVDRNLDLLDTQIAEANKRLETSKGEGGANFIQNAILGPLKDKRAATIERIAIAIGRSAAKPTGLDQLATCALKAGAGAPPAPGGGTEPQPAPDNNEPSGDATAQQVDCPDVAGKLPTVPEQAAAEVDRNLALLDTQIAEANKRLETSKGEGGANFIQNAILGPLKDKRAATIERIAIAIGRVAAKPTGLDQLATCALKAGAGAPPAPGGGTEPLPGPDDSNELPGNDGTIVKPESAQLTFRGSPVGQVGAMPKFLRVLYGDAKVSTNGPANARPSWTCSGFENRLIDKYPICPAGSKVKRVHTFPSCWDGKNTDSANHRTHIVFPDAKTGKCANGFKAVPQLQITLTYNIPRDVQLAKQYAVDAFPQEKHNPITDHDDFANVMSQSIMNRLVNCINTKRTCRE